MRMKSRIAARPGGESEVTVVSDVSVTGVMAQFGRGLMQDVSNQMLERFTEAMRAELEKPEAAGTAPALAGVAAAPSAPAPSAPPLEVSSVVLRQPAFWVVVLVVAAVVVWLLAR
jgi:hypothetical protein